MEQEEYEDYLVDRAKELLNEQMETEPDKGPNKPEMKNKRNSMDEKVEREASSKIPVSWDPQEVEALVRNRKDMTNDELDEFLRKDSKIQEEIEDFEWNGFSRWEERFIIQHHMTMDTEGIAGEIDRDPREVELKMRIMGLNPDGSQN